MNTKEIFKKCLKPRPKPFNSILENGDKADYFEGVDIEKPESLTPMEMELKIQADRVMFSLNKTISILSVMAHLPFLLQENAKILAKHLKPSEHSFILFVLNSYHTSTNQSTSEESAQGREFYDMINKIKLGESGRSRTNRPSSTNELVLDMNLAQVINIIYSNKCIRQEIKNATNSQTIPFVVEFIKKFNELKAMAKIKLYVTGTEEEARDKTLRQAFKSNSMLTAAISDLEQQLETQRKQLGDELNKTVELFEKYNTKIAKIKEEFQISIEKNIHESERKMMQQCNESEAKQAILAEEAELITKQYENLLDDDIAEEGNLRARTLKTHTELKNWLTKYDQDIGEKQAEYEALKNQYDAEKAAMDELDEKMDEQEKVYIVAMAEKDAEEEKLYQEMAFKMLMNRSARIIQRAWRAFRERRSKRKGKKGKKGKDDKPKLTYTKKEDPNVLLEGKFKSDVFEDLKNPNAF